MQPSFNASSTSWVRQAAKWTADLQDTSPNFWLARTFSRIAAKVIHFVKVRFSPFPSTSGGQWKDKTLERIGRVCWVFVRQWVSLSRSRLGDGWWKINQWREREYLVQSEGRLALIFQLEPRLQLEMYYQLNYQPSIFFQGEGRERKYGLSNFRGIHYYISHFRRTGE